PCASSRIPRSPTAHAASSLAPATSARSAPDDASGGGDRSGGEGRVKASRHLPILAVVVAVAIVGLRGASTGAADAAGAASPTPVGATCASADRAFRALVETVRAKSDELAHREAEVAAREAGLAQARTVVTGEVARLEAIAKELGIIGGPGAGM